MGEHYGARVLLSNGQTIAKTQVYTIITDRYILLLKFNEYLYFSFFE